MQPTYPLPRLPSHSQATLWRPRACASTRPTPATRCTSRACRVSAWLGLMRGHCFLSKLATCSSRQRGGHQPVCLLGSRGEHQLCVPRNSWLRLRRSLAVQPMSRGASWLTSSARTTASGCVGVEVHKSRGGCAAAVRAATVAVVCLFTCSRWPPRGACPQPAHAAVTPRCRPAPLPAAARACAW